MTFILFGDRGSQADCEEGMGWLGGRGREGEGGSRDGPTAFLRFFNLFVWIPWFSTCPALSSPSRTQPPGPNTAQMPRPEGGGLQGGGPPPHSCPGGAAVFRVVCRVGG